MSAAPAVINPQNVTEIAQRWNSVHLIKKDSGKGPSPATVDASSSSDEINAKVRKPYTITKQRERWTESEHQNFLEALKLYGRAWRRIEEYIGTKTAVQIRSHAQKFFSKLERDASSGSSAGKLPDIAIPPPRPKRKPRHPYPKKAGSSSSILEDESKEFSSLSSAGIEAAHPDGFQSGPFNPCVSQGLGSGTRAFLRSPLVHGHGFGPQGSVNFFGKTVVVPRPGSLKDSSKECLISKDSASLGKQSSVSEPKRIVGFSPFLKVKKSADNLFKAPLDLNRNGSCSGATQPESTGELLERTCGYDLVGPDTEATDLNNGECKGRGDAGLQKVESGFSAVDLKEGEKINVQFLQSTNAALQSWMDNLLHYHSSFSSPPIPPKGVGNGASSSPLSYWQFMQASAANYAAYTAAMVAAAAAGWKASNAGGTDIAEFVKGNTNETQLPFVPSSWWPYRGFVPPLYFPPSIALHQRENWDSFEDAKALGNEKEIGALKDIPTQGGQSDTDFKAVGEAGICEPSSKLDVEDDGKDYTSMNSASQKGSRMSPSCITEASGSAKFFRDAECQHYAGSVEMPVKFSTHGSDTETRAISTAPQIAYSSSDEFEIRGKKQSVGSSSGSNTPASRYQSSECDASIVLESKKRDSYTLCEDNDDGFSEAFQNSHQQYVTNTADLPKLKLKLVEKTKKYQQQRDLSHGGSDDSKRLKSCALELELRKEVSQEGRKAFQALFTSKLLPQTFPPSNLEGFRKILFQDERVSRSTMSKNESRLNECSNITGVSQGEGDDTHNSAHLETASGFQGLNRKPLSNGKGFTVSSSSGFVPYRRPVCPEFMNL